MDHIQDFPPMQHLQYDTTDNLEHLDLSTLSILPTMINTVQLDQLMNQSGEIVGRSGSDNQPYSTRSTGAILILSFLIPL